MNGESRCTVHSTGALKIPNLDLSCKIPHINYCIYKFITIETPFETPSKPVGGIFYNLTKDAYVSQGRDMKTDRERP